MKRIASIAFGLSLLFGSAGACSKKSSNDDARKKLIDAMVNAGRPKAQATCLVDKIDNKLLDQLQKGHVPDNKSAEFKTYTKAISVCLNVK